MDSRVRVCVPEQTPTVNRFPSNPAKVTTVTSFRYFGYGRVWIGDRDGWFYEVEAEPAQGFEAGVYVHTSLEVMNSVKIEVNGKSVETNPAGHAKMRQLRSVVGGLVRELFTEALVSEEVIDAKGGVVYIPSCDIIVSRQCPIANKIHHPYSSMGQLHPGDVLDVEGDVASKLRLRLIDNNRVTGNRWYRVGDFAQQVEPEVNLHLEDGLYVSYSGPETVGWEHKYFPLKDVLADKAPIKLHGSRSEALSEDRNRELELEIARLKRVNDLGKQEHEIEKLSKQTTNETEKLLLDYIRRADEERERERKARLEVEQREVDLLRKQREAEHKDYLEARAERRKNTTDLLKMIPAVVSLAVALLALYKKSK